MTTKREPPAWLSAEPGPETDRQVAEVIGYTAEPVTAFSTRHGAAFRALEALRLAGWSISTHHHPPGKPRADSLPHVALASWDGDPEARPVITWPLRTEAAEFPLAVARLVLGIGETRQVSRDLEA